jgi:hypothetical protein
VLALLYLMVRDYKTVELTPRLDRATRTTRDGGRLPSSGRWFARGTMLWVCVGGAAQLVVVSAIWSWLPSFLNRVHGLAPDQAALRAALVVLCGAVGSVVWGAVVDRAGRKRPRAKLYAMSLLCIVSLLVLVAAFGAPGFGMAMQAQAQWLFIAAGGFLMTCTVGPVSAVVIDVIHPGIRATGASVLALFQNLFGSGRRALHRGAPLRYLGAGHDAHGHAGLRRAGRAGLHGRVAQLRGRPAACRRAARRWA